MISQDTIEKIRTSIDIVELVREHVPGLKRSGRNFKACCPFHQERTPSFMVSPDKGIFHCFGCGVGGDSFRFIMKMDGLEFVEAIKKLGDRLGITVEDTWQESANPVIKQRQKIYTLLEQAGEFYHLCLEKTSEAHQTLAYLRRRGISRESIGRFTLGYAPVSGHALRDAAVKKGFKEDMLVHAGLIGVSSNTGNFRDQFRGRLMFPIHDTQGRVIAFGARVLDDSLPKYINSSETSVFHKSRVLYGIFQGLKAIRSKNKVIVLEGYTDIILAHQYGFDNAVASLGTALTREHALILKRYVEEVILVFDPDTAGKNAALRAAELLSDLGLFVKIAVLPDSLDPADFFIQRGPREFESILTQAKDWIEFHIDCALTNVEHLPLRAEEKTRIAGMVLPGISRIENAVYRQEMRRLLSRKIDVPEDVLLEESNRVKEKKNYQSQKTSVSPSGAVSRDIRIQEELIRLLFSNPQMWKDINLDENNFMDKRCLEIFIAMRNDFHTSGEVNAARIIASLPEAYAAWLSGVLFEKREYSKPGRIIQELQDELKKSNLKHERSQLEEEICRMLEGQENFDEKKVSEYHRLLRSLKGGEQHGKV